MHSRIPDTYLLLLLPLDPPPINVKRHVGISRIVRIHNDAGRVTTNRFHLGIFSTSRVSLPEEEDRYVAVGRKKGKIPGVES